MRDALSIMDQAIASAPCVEGRPVLSALQIRELMGSVPNAVFERLLEAVAAGESAALMEQLNTLLNAGHSAFSMARQMVRYLRNTLMAKLGGEKTELLQISGDERARAARSAMLFSEEEITRNLQIMLTTFDALNETQEHRFHLELGLLKLVHAQRLLPLEQLLSSVSGGVAPRSAPRASGSRASSAPSRPASAPVSSVSLAPAQKPGTSPAVVAEMEQPAFAARDSAWLGAALGAKADFAGISMPSVQTAELAAESAAEVAPFTPPSGPIGITAAPTVEALRLAVISALADAGHASAAQLLGAGAWSLDGSNLRIEVAGMGKKMLALTVNAAAEKIMRQELQRLGAPARFLVVPGEGAVTAAAAVPVAGSIQEMALANPLVQRAKEIFKAEVRSVVDLRTN
jgi:DNA polymerase-3 subunit gamma/tau